MPTDKPPLGLLSATTLVAASMIGAGVYTTSGFTLAALGSPALVITAWIVAGLIATCGAIGYSSLASCFTESGGEYLFLSRSLHPVAGLMAGVVSLLAGFTGAIAVAAWGLEAYLAPMIDLELPARSIAIGAVVLCATLHSLGVAGPARVQDAMVMLKLALIVAIVVVAALSADRWAVPVTGRSSSCSPLTFAQQLVWISLSYSGFNAAVYIAGEIRNPVRNVPRAMVGGTIVVMLIYIVLNSIFVVSAPAAVITDPQRIAQVATTAARSIGGESFSLFVRVVIVVSLMTSVSALIMSGPRVYAKMADDRFLPRWLRFRDRPPIAAIWFQASLAAAAISISSLKVLLGYLGLTLSVSAALTVAMLFVLRRRGEVGPLPLKGVPAATYVIATAVLAVLYAVDQPLQTIAVAITILVGAVLYPWIGSRLESVSDA